MKQSMKVKLQPSKVKSKRPPKAKINNLKNSLKNRGKIQVCFLNNL